MPGYTYVYMNKHIYIYVYVSSPSRDTNEHIIELYQVPGMKCLCIALYAQRGGLRVLVALYHSDLPKKAKLRRRQQFPVTLQGLPARTSVDPS